MTWRRLSTRQVFLELVHVLWLCGKRDTCGVEYEYCGDMIRNCGLQGRMFEIWRRLRMPWPESFHHLFTQLLAWIWCAKQDFSLQILQKHDLKNRIQDILIPFQVLCFKMQWQRTSFLALTIIRGPWSSLCVLPCLWWGKEIRLRPLFN